MNLIYDDNRTYVHGRCIHAPKDRSFHTFLLNGQVSAALIQEGAEAGTGTPRDAKGVPNWFGFLQKLATLYIHCPVSYNEGHCKIWGQSFSDKPFILIWFDGMSKFQYMFLMYLFEDVFYCFHLFSPLRGMMIPAEPIKLSGLIHLPSDGVVFLPSVLSQPYSEFGLESMDRPCRSRSQLSGNFHQIAAFDVPVLEEKSSLDVEAGSRQLRVCHLCKSRTFWLVEGKIWNNMSRLISSYFKIFQKV